MLVLITQFTHSDPGTPLQLCEPCGRKQATRLGARWPEPHEYAADTKNGRVTTRVRVLKDRAYPCDHCQVERELSDVDACTVLAETFERIARRG